jgi:hypothetical protein
MQGCIQQLYASVHCRPDPEFGIFARIKASKRRIKTAEFFHVGRDLHRSSVVVAIAIKA